MDAFDVWYSLENALPLIGTTARYITWRLVGLVEERDSTAKPHGPYRKRGRKRNR